MLVSISLRFLIFGTEKINIAYYDQQSFDIQNNLHQANDLIASFFSLFF